jgi:hypothetical protein
MKFQLIGTMAISIGTLVGPALAGDEQQMGTTQLSNGLRVSLGVGYSSLYLPETKITTITDILALEFKDQVSDIDSRTSGARWDLALQGISLSDSTSLGVKGFYANLSASKSSQCVSDPVNDEMCVFLPMIDPDVNDINGDFIGQPLSVWETEASRSVKHWGIALEAERKGYMTGGGMKDEPVQHSGSPFRLGIGMRGIDQTVHLTSNDNSIVLDPVSVNYDLDTRYYGAYVGYSRGFDMGHGVTFGIDGDIGLYYAKTTASADFHVFAPLGSGLSSGPTELDQALSLSENKVAVVSSMKASLTKDLGSVRISLDAQGDWYSYVPTLNYNNTDRAGGFDLIGDNDGTSLGSDNAFGYTLGGRLTVPLSR